MISIPAYLYSPHFLSQAVHSFMGPMTSGNSVSTSNMLRQMGYPPMSQVIPIIQYSTIGMIIAGMGLMLFGSIAKKIARPSKVKPIATQSEEMQEISTDPHLSNEKPKATPPSLRILQERLVKGEITPTEFQNLKRFLE